MTPSLKIFPVRGSCVDIADTCLMIRDISDTVFDAVAKINPVNGVLLETRSNYFQINLRSYSKDGKFCAPKTVLTQELIGVLGDYGIPPTSHDYRAAVSYLVQLDSKSHVLLFFT